MEEQQTTTREVLLHEEPKLDAVLKSLYSWLAAHPSQTVDSNTALKCTRSMSKAINQYCMPLAMFKSDEQEDRRRSLVERVWNELAGTPGIRVTQTLGRSSLLVAWSNDLKQDAMTFFLEATKTNTASVAVAARSSSTTKTTNEEETANSIMTEYIQLFEQMLYLQHADAACLIWGTKEQQEVELNRRATVRIQTAQQRLLQQQRNYQTPTIQELSEEEEAENETKEE